MWPWAHVAAAYLLLAGVQRARGRGPPSGIATIAVGFGAALPDLIDKPLAWWFEVLVYGRSLGHSLLVGAVPLVIIGMLARRYGHQSTAGAFTLGYLAHLAGDAYEPAILGEWEHLQFLAWPILTPPEITEVTSIITRLQQVEPTPFFVFEVVITLAGIALWWAQGRPGLSTVTGLMRSPDVS